MKIPDPQPAGFEIDDAAHARSPDDSGAGDR
jgi:hypothetical protein